MDASFFDGDEMQALRHSLYFKVDASTPLREKILDYINASTYNPQDAFFFDMIPAIRFLYNDRESIAYTTPDKLIWLNVPHEYSKVEEWDFIYFHECLHQLWDTFGVEEEIKKQGIKCHHRLLNLASDCVINDFLAAIRKKKEPSGLINPQWVKDHYGVTYNRYIDDQITLYKKMLEAKEEKNITDDEDYGDMGEGDGENQTGQGDDEGQNSGGQGKGNGKGQNNDGDNEDQPGQNGGKGEDQTGKGDDKGQNSGGQGKGNGKGDGTAQDAEGSPRAGSFSGGKLDKSKPVDNGFSYDPKYEKIAKQYVNDIHNQYKNSLGGQLGDFLGKCKDAKKHIADLKNADTGMTLKVNDGGSRAWNKKFNSTIDTYVTQQVRKASSQFKKSWRYVKRGSGPVKFGAPLQQGKERVRDGISINMGFYVDTSGSMLGSPIKNCCKAVNHIIEETDKNFLKNPIVKGTEYLAYSFDDYFHKEKVPLGIHARNAGNIDLDELLNGMLTKTQTSMINVILTDADFPANPSVCVPIIKKFSGLLVFVINSTKHSADYEEIEKQCKNFKYIEADENFTV